MFVRKKEKLPNDARYPTDLDALGYRITPLGKIVTKELPPEHFKFRFSTSSRHNEAQREAMHDCVRDEIINVLERMGLQRLYLPNLESGPPADAIPFIPILATPPELLKSKKQIVIIVNNAQEDLGVLSWRMLTRDAGIKGGSVIDFISEIQSRSSRSADAEHEDREKHMPGIVILNPGQRLFSHKHRKAMTQITWMAAPRPTSVHPPPNIHDKFNRVAGNKSIDEHVEFVFKNVLLNREITGAEASLFIVGVAEGGDAIVKYLEQNLDRHNVAALAITAPVPVLPATSSFPLTEKTRPLLDMLASRARAWCISQHPLGRPLANPSPVDEILDAASKKPVEEEGSVESMLEVALCPMVSGGDAQHPECILPKAGTAILDWFAEVATSAEACQYKNLALEVEAAMQQLTLNRLPREPQTWAEE